MFLIVTGPWGLSAQPSVCQGNLGENIFTEGDFGSGTDVLRPDDPGIAPGYNYVRSTPPSDGSYVITNNSGRWTNIYGTWLEIPDNSNDPNGYMMVVNADFTPGLFYNQQVDGLCSNTLYEFSADVINMIRREVTDHIKPNVSFLIDDEEVFTTGEIPQDENWHTYGFTFTTGPGQTTVQLSLRNNAPGGIGNDLALDNISFRPCGPEALILPRDVANICEDGDPIDLAATINGDQYDTPAYQWQSSFDDGSTWENIDGANGSVFTHTELSSGFYHYRFLLANEDVNLDNVKCRVISNPKVVYVVPKFYTVIDTICQGLSYPIGENEYTASGTYVDTLLSSIGCDSIVTLQLTVVPDADMQADVTVMDLTCHDSRDGQITIESVTNGTPPLNYQLTNLPAASGPPWFDLPDGVYELEISDRYGCRFRESYLVGRPSPFEVDLGPDLSVALGEKAELRPSANYPVASFSWRPPEAIDCSQGCASPVWYPTETQRIALDAVSDRGCQASDSVTIRVSLERRVFFPNAFSPNGDNVNDYFAVFGDQPNVQVIRSLQIFDRWGNQLFERKDLQPNDPETGWDGTARGRELPEGIYVYAAEVEFLDGATLIFSGDVALLR